MRISTFPCDPSTKELGLLCVSGRWEDLSALVKCHVATMTGFPAGIDAITTIAVSRLKVTDICEEKFTDNLTN